MARYTRFPLADIGHHTEEVAARQVLVDIDAIDAIIEAETGGITTLIADGISFDVNVPFLQIAAVMDHPGTGYATLPADWPRYPANARSLQQMEAALALQDPTDKQPSVDGFSPPATITTEDGTTITTATEQGAQ